ncbi:MULTISPECIES: serine/threonine-protein kinase [unclassified Streptomyces]|uniref:serine/threonine-protein kinase n=1 Tax=unclassified Streptomyces TaxID=2593676 RepID=UPI0004CB0705|nr:serine/threonine-protein kinase [Streptomyces sp. NRRL F-5630]
MDGRDAGGLGAEDPAGRLLAGRYRLGAVLGAGGTGTVWQARDEDLAREVAVKEVRVPAGVDAAERERQYARVEREALAAARSGHQGIVTVYDVVVADGRPWIVMELVRGLSLADVLTAEGPLPPARAARVGLAVLDALGAAHAVGVVHRDVTPANILLGNDGRVVLTDFGTAALRGARGLTLPGEVVGSPASLAPERAEGAEPGPEGDLWSLGVVLWTAVEGGPPFRGATPLAAVRAAVEDPLPHPVQAGPLTPVLEGLLRKDPALRLPAERAARQLREVAEGREPAEERDAEPGPGRGAEDATAEGAAAPSGTTPAPITPEEPRHGRATPYSALLGAGLAVLVAAAVLVWVLVRD